VAKKTARRSRTRARTAPEAPQAPDTGAVVRLSLDQVIGQPAAIATLDRALASGRIHHAWIFSGPEGVGKLTTALAFAAALLDPSTAPTFSGQVRPDPDSPVQQLLRAGAHPDLHVVRKELGRFSESATVRASKFTTIPKDVIDVHVVRAAGLAAQMTGGPAKKVFIIDEAELLDAPGQSQSQNALLKTLEEPPPGTVLILVTANEARLLPTIRSRCQRVRFGLLDAQAMEQWLRSAELPAGVDARAALDLGAGSPGRALLAATTGMVDWPRTLGPMLGDMLAGRFPGDFADAAAGAIDEWAKRRVEGDANASKDAANKAAARALFGWVQQQWQAELARAVEAPDRAESLAEAIELADQAAELVGQNVQAVFAAEWLASEATRRLAVG
jgi:DNA polymerase-3 subunit delta'